MKYGIEDYKKKEVIGNYTTSEDKIIITFLDGNIYEMPLTKENEADLLNKMVVQAKARQEGGALLYAREKRRACVIWALANAGLALTCIGAYAFSDLDTPRTIACAIGAMAGAIVVVIKGKEYKFHTDEIREYLKYDVFLSMRKNLEKYGDDPNLFNGVEKKSEVLNINTLDSYSLDEVVVIRNNLKRSMFLSQALEIDAGTPKL